MTTGETLKHHWLRHGVDIEVGVSESKLNAFEHKYKVYLPQDLRDYFTLINGMSPGVMDGVFIRFWMLDEIKPLSEDAPEYAAPNYIDDANSVFVFADWSVWAHAFGIRLSPAKEQVSNTVYVLGYLPAVPIARSFSEFVDLYLTDKDRLITDF